MTDRVIVLVDMDCFYVQVEQKLQPEFKGKPCAVAQYNNWQGGGLIAVNYEARELGVKRGMRGDEAKSKCPDIHLFSVPEVRGKADLTRYREASAEVMEVLCQFSECVERASIDEAYLDMTAVVTTDSARKIDEVTAQKLHNTFIVGWENTSTDAGSEDIGVKQWLHHVYEDCDAFSPDLQLTAAAVIVEEMRATVFAQTGMFCSAGIAHNKMLAKLACGLHKPNRQTLLPQSSVPVLFKDLPIPKVRNLGGKHGEEVMNILGIKVMRELETFSESYLQDCFGEKTGSWLHQLARGIDTEAVTSRLLPKSIGCGKNFPGKSSLSTHDQVSHWVQQLAEELEERLVKDRVDNKRVAKTLTISVRCQGDQSSTSRACTIYVYKASQLAFNAFRCLQKLNTASPSSKQWTPSVVAMSMSASKFVDDFDSATLNIEKYFSTADKHGKDSPVNIFKTMETAGCKSVQSNLHQTECTSNPERKVKDSIDMAKSRVHALPPQEEEIPVTVEAHAKGEESTSPLTENEACAPGELPLHREIKKPEMGFFARKMAELSAAKDIPSCSKSSVNKNETERSTTNNFSAELQIDDTVPVNSKVRTRSNLASLSTDIKEADSYVLHLEANAPFRNTIKRYFPAKDNTDSVESCEQQDLLEEVKVKCPLCSTMVLVWEKQEHEDFHLAAQLQSQLDSNTAPVNKVNTSAIHSKKQPTRKRRHGTRKRQPLKKKNTVKTLDSYLV